MTTSKNVLSSDVEIKGSIKFSHDLIIEVLVLDRGDIVHGILDIDDLTDLNKVLET